MNSILVLIGTLVGVIVYVKIVRPFASNTCLVDSHRCINLEYQTTGNTALIHDLSSGRHIWFVGDDILLYGEPTGRICDDGHDAAYVWNLSTNEPKGYICSSPVDVIKQRYYSNAPVGYMSIKTKGTLDMFGMVNELIDRNVISIPTPAKVT